MFELKTALNLQKRPDAFDLAAAAAAPLSSPLQLSHTLCTLSLTPDA